MWWVVQRWACDPTGANESTTRLFLGMLGKKKIFFLVYLELWGYEGWSCGGHHATVGSLRMKSTHRTEKRERLDALFLIPLYPAGPNDPWTFQLYQIKSSLLLKAAYVCFNVTCTQKSPEPHNPYWFWEVWTSGMFKTCDVGLVNCGEGIAQGWDCLWPHLPSLPPRMLNPGTCKTFQLRIHVRENY